MSERLQHLLHDHFASLSLLLESQADVIERAANILLETLVADRRIFACGNGGSMANAQSFVSKLVNRFEHERPALPAMALSPDCTGFSSFASDGHLAEVFARPFGALAQAGDVLVVLSASSSAANITQAVRAAHDRDCRVIAITAQDGGEVMHMVSEQDVLLCLPSQGTARLHELQLFVLHALCDLIDQALFGAHHA